MRSILNRVDSKHLPPIIFPSDKVVIYGKYFFPNVQAVKRLIDPIFLHKLGFYFVVEFDFDIPDILDPSIVMVCNTFLVNYAFTKKKREPIAEYRVGGMPFNAEDFFVVINITP